MEYSLATGGLLFREKNLTQILRRKLAFRITSFPPAYSYLLTTPQDVPFLLHHHRRLAFSNFPGSRIIQKSGLAMPALFIFELHFCCPASQPSQSRGNCLPNEFSHVRRYRTRTSRGGEPIACIFALFPMPKFRRFGGMLRFQLPRR